MGILDKVRASLDHQSTYWKIWASRAVPRDRIVPHERAEPRIVVGSPRWVQTLSLSNLIHHIWHSATPSVRDDRRRRAMVRSTASELAFRIATGDPDAAGTHPDGLERIWPPAGAAGPVDPRVYLLVWLLYQDYVIRWHPSFPSDHGILYLAVSSWVALFSSDRGSSDDTLWHTVDRGLILTARESDAGRALLRITLTRAGRDLVERSASYGIVRD